MGVHNEIEARQSNIDSRRNLHMYGSHDLSLSCKCKFVITSCFIPRVNDMINMWGFALASVRRDKGGACEEYTRT
jgi:hypothetical protein